MEALRSKESVAGSPPLLKTKSLATDFSLVPRSATLRTVTTGE